MICIGELPTAAPVRRNRVGRPIRPERTVAIAVGPQATGLWGVWETGGMGLTGSRLLLRFPFLRRPFAPSLTSLPFPDLLPPPSLPGRRISFGPRAPLLISSRTSGCPYPLFFPVCPPCSLLRQSRLAVGRVRPEAVASHPLPPS